jgi:DNA-binding helix-hairpin-helix protein with protein kinase domain
VSVAPRDIVDKQGRAVSLSKLLGRGGEGTVYEVANDPNIAAKIYMPDKANARREKISSDGAGKSPLQRKRSRLSN